MNRLKPYFKALAVAIVFLTRLPMPRLEEIKPEDSRRASLLFPAVGLIIGLLLYFLAVISMPVFSSGVVAALLLIAWVFITGGLHIDGLSDSADAWLGGLGDRQRSLEIMKDSRNGSGALMAVSSLMIAKYAALSYLLESQAYTALLIIPMLGRAASLLIFRFTPYVRTGGSAQSFIQGLNHKSIDIALLLYGFVALMLLGFSQSLWVLFSAGLAWVLLRRMMMLRLGGCTGDTAGATVELIELTALLALCSSH